MKIKLVKSLSKFLSPHLSKAIGSNRPLPSKNWRLETNPPPPPPHPFSGKKFNNYVEEVMSDPNEIKKRQALADLRRPYRILCLDGGGVRGALTTVILKRIVKHHPNFLNEVDLICGTSAGGLITLMLGCGYSPDECDDIFAFGSPHIFAFDPWRVINPFRAKYSDKNKLEIMRYYLGERRFGDLTKTCVVVAFRLDGRKSHTHSFFNREGWRPAVFSNMPRLAGVVEPDLDLKLWDAAMRTSAAPTFFPVFRGYTDGGIVANNPSLIGVSKAMAHFPHLPAKNIVLLSIGAGQYPRHTSVLENARDPSEIPSEQESNRKKFDPLDHADWGIRQWIPFLLDIILDGDTVMTDLVMHYQLGAGNKMYHRIDPRLPRQIALDDVMSIKELQDFGNSLDLSKTFKFVDERFTFDHGEFDNEIHNSLDNASQYHEAWLSSLE